MRRPPQRMECPACLGVAMESASVADGLKVHHCGRCGGSWLRGAQIPRLREVPASALRTMITRRDDASFVCHGCHQPMERDAVRCAACEWPNRLDCPDCGRTMYRETRRDVTVDVCRGCKAVWLDHHELGSLWAVAAAGAIAASRHGDTILAAGADAGEFLLDALWYAPDLTVGAVELTVRAAGAGVEALAHAPGLLASLPELLGGFAEVAADVAGAVFGLIAEIIGGLFDGL